MKGLKSGLNLQVSKKESGKTGAGRGDFLCGSRLLSGGLTVNTVDGLGNGDDGLGTLLSSRGLLLYRLYNKE